MESTKMYQIQFKYIYSTNTHDPIWSLGAWKLLVMQKRQWLAASICISATVTCPCILSSPAFGAFTALALHFQVFKTVVEFVERPQNVKGRVATVTSADTCEVGRWQWFLVQNPSKCYTCTYVTYAYVWSLPQAFTETWVRCMECMEWDAQSERPGLQALSEAASKEEDARDNETSWNWGSFLEKDREVSQRNIRMTTWERSMRATKSFSDDLPRKVNPSDCSIHWSL